MTSNGGVATADRARRLGREFDMMWETASRDINLTRIGP